MTPHPPSTSQPRVGLNWRGETRPAVAVALRGGEACLVVEKAPPSPSEVRLVLDWPAGETTWLGGTLREVEDDGHVARVDIHAVHGDWRPFLVWLGRSCA